MFAGGGAVRAAYRRLHESLATAKPAELTARSEALERALVDQGITFSHSGQERPFPLDLVPRVITATEWTRLERGLVQRVRALEAFLADIYGDQQIDGARLCRRVPAQRHLFGRDATAIEVLVDVTRLA